MHPRATAGVLTEIVEPAAGRGPTDAPPAARRVTLGFQGGQVLALRVSDEQLKASTRRSAAPAGTSSTARTGRCGVDLAQLVYVSADSGEPRVGFG